MASAPSEKSKHMNQKGNPLCGIHHNLRELSEPPELNIPIGTRRERASKESVNNSHYFLIKEFQMNYGLHSYIEQ